MRVGSCSQTDLIQERRKLGKHEGLVAIRCEPQQRNELVNLRRRSRPKLIIGFFHIVVKLDRGLGEIRRRRWFYELSYPKRTTILFRCQFVAHECGI